MWKGNIGFLLYRWHIGLFSCVAFIHFDKTHVLVRKGKSRFHFSRMWLPHFRIGYIIGRLPMCCIFHIPPSNPNNPKFSRAFGSWTCHFQSSYTNVNTFWVEETGNNRLFIYLLNEETDYGENSTKENNPLSLLYSLSFSSFLSIMKTIDSFA